MDVINFRISGPAIEHHALLRAFSLDGVVCKEIFKVHAHGTANRLKAYPAALGQDVVALKIRGGPLLVLHPSHARDLLRLANGPSAESTDVVVTNALPWTRACGGAPIALSRQVDAELDWFAILTPVARELDDIARTIDPPQALLHQFNPCVVKAGGKAPTIPIQVDQKNIVVFLHGLFGTATSFGKLAAHESVAAELLQHYGEHNVLTFEHPTLTQDPLANALALVQQVPPDKILDLVTHGSGGLVGEVMVRASGGQTVASPDHHTDARVNELQTLMRSKRIEIRRMVRVACPARGTLMVSGRIDAWLSGVQWAARSSSATVPDKLLSLLCEAARSKADAACLPGLQALLPSSALNKWLNSPLPELHSELFVVAGDSRGDGLTNWLQTLMADAYLWTDSDLVFQTRSMYGGVPRAPGPKGPRYLVKQDGQVTHFSYFASRKRVQSVVDALKGNAGADWQPIGPESWRGRGPSPARNHIRTDRSRPTVLLLPDVFGSVLTDSSGTKLWLDQGSVGAIERLAINSTPEAKGCIGGRQGVQPARVLHAYYGELHEYLARTHNVVDCPYDWRADIETTAATFDERIAAMHRSGELGEQPVRLVAHGMGALVVRAWHAGHRASWNRVMTRSGSRVLLVGPPNAGCFLPLRLFSGDDTFGTLLVSAGTLTADALVRETLAGMPGLVQLQAGLSVQGGKLHDRQTWLNLERSEQRDRRACKAWHGECGGTGGLDRWAIPEAHVLAKAAELWTKLESALPALLRDSERIAVVAGIGHATVTHAGADCNTLYLTTTEDGDRYVALDSAALPGVPLYVTDDAHDALTYANDTIEGLEDLLARGETDRLNKFERNSRGGLQVQHKRQDERRLCWHGGQVLSGQGIRELMVAAGALENCAGKARLQVNVHHGDLRFIRAPLMVGHYKSMTLTGAEGVIDGLLSNRMAKALRAGVYPEREGSFQIFENGRHSPAGRHKQRYIPRPSSAVVIGLGEEGKLTAQILSYTVRIGVIAYAERYSESHEKAPSFELAATLIGSGGSGVSVSAAALALVQGVFEANMRLREVGWPTVCTLSIVEMYLDRATDAWRVLRMQAESTGDLLVNERLMQGDGGLRRPLDTSYRGATYDFISAVRSADSTKSHPKIAYSLDTRRARTEVRAQQAQGSLVRDLVRRACCTTRPDKLIGRTLFNLLIPVEIEPYLTGSSDMLMELDATTAALPWEMLDTDPPQHAVSSVGARPWSIRSKVLRKLRTEGYRDQVRDAAVGDQMLVIGAPAVTDPRYEAIPGAKSEARAIAEVARAAFAAADAVTELTDAPIATTVINALFARNYRIVHIAGHGNGVDECARGGGVVLSGDATFLGANEIRAMRVTPELVFLNCCHLGGTTGPQYDRVAFAAGVATQLIDIGVRCVVLAGWAIEDAPAEVFARIFYRELFAGKRFIDAVGAARYAAWESEPKCSTWAAYQCYGDPEWSWKPAGEAVIPLPEEEYAGVASPLTLVLVLDAIGKELVHMSKDDGGRNRARLEYLEQRFGDLRDRGDVSEAFANAFSLLPDRVKALEWSGHALKATDSVVSLSTIELHAEQLSVPGATDEELRRAIALFHSIQTTHGITLRRCSMLGNAYRRLSVLLRKKGRSAYGKAAENLEYARRQFDVAAQIEADSLYRFYPLRAALSCRLREQLLERLVRPVTDEERDDIEVDLALTLREIQQAVAKEPQFWTTVAQTEYDIIKGIARENLASLEKDIRASLCDLHNRISTRRYWQYVYYDAESVLTPYLALTKQPGEENASAEAVLRQLKSYEAGEVYTDDPSGQQG